MYMYDYDTNVIWSHPKNWVKILILSSESMLATKSSMKLTSPLANITPIIHRLDNEISDKIICVTKKKGLRHQIVTAHDHRQLPVKRDIGTWKNRLTSCLHGADKHFPAHLWCRTIDQVNI